MSQSATLLTSVEVAQELGYSLAKVKRLAQRGDLPVAQKLPGGTGAYLFHREEIERIRTKDT